MELPRLFLMTGLMLLGLGCTEKTLAVDPWAYFHPELVHRYGCHVYDTEIVLNGMTRGEMVWEALAFAERTDGEWRHEVGRFPYTERGRHRAEKACSKWQDEAEKQVNGVHK